LAKRPCQPAVSKEREMAEMLCPYRELKVIQESMGLTHYEICHAVFLDPGALLRMQAGKWPGDFYRARLAALGRLARVMRDSMRPAAAHHWMDRPHRKLGGRPPREVLVDGRSEWVLGVLLSERAGP
jgi:hypothetical protein